MANNNFIYTRYEWLDRIAAKSPVAAALDVKHTSGDEIYKEAGQKASRNKDAFNFANSEPHNELVARTIEGLAERGAPGAILRKLLLDLTSRNTYGTICELSAYAFLLKGNHDFDVQSHLDGADILNPNGADLDGVMRLPEEIFFDIKAFGFHEHLVNCLTERLSDDFAPDIVVAEESWDVPVSLLFDLSSTQYNSLKEELKANRAAHRGAIRFEVRAPSRVQVTSRTLNPEELAAHNAEYAFTYAKQFVRAKPFFLIFVIHPWVSGSLHHNFAGLVDTFTRHFASKTFCQFRADQSVRHHNGRGIPPSVWNYLCEHLGRGASSHVAPLSMFPEPVCEEQARSILHPSVLVAIRI